MLIPVNGRFTEEQYKHMKEVKKKTGDSYAVYLRKLVLRDMQNEKL